MSSLRKIELLSALALIGITNVAAAACGPNGGSSAGRANAAGTASGTISREQMQVAQRQFQASAQAQQTAAVRSGQGAQAPGLLPLEGPCLAGYGASASNQATAAAGRRMPQSRTSKPKPAKASSRK